MSGIWEPWAPEIGQRVRVRISPECAVHAAHRDLTTDSADGLVGEVTADYRVGHPLLTGPSEEYRERSKQTVASGHWWRVDFGTPFGVRFDGQPISADLCAAAELEPIP